jgi:hypothetical protein
MENLVFPVCELIFKMDHITKAANWWAERLRAPSYYKSNDEEEEKKFIPKRQEFEKYLDQLIRENIQKEKEVRLKTDYDPEGLLKDAAVEAKISWQIGTFPTKVVMLVDKDKVMAWGSGGTPQILF